MAASHPFSDKYAPQTPFMAEEPDRHSEIYESPMPELRSDENSPLMFAARNNENIFNCTTECTPITKALSTAGGGIFGGLMGVETGIVTSTSPLLCGVSGLFACASLTFFSTFFCAKKPNVANGNAPEVNNSPHFP